MSTIVTEWIAGDEAQAKIAREELQVWPLDSANAKLLNEVHPPKYTEEVENKSEDPEEYDLIAIGAGAGGLVSSRQSARRGAKSALISEHLAGGDCLNVGCVPSKALIRAARAFSEVKRAAEFGIIGVAPPSELKIDFKVVMKRLREVRAKIAPADGHAGTIKAGAKVYQGRGIFTSPNTIDVNGKTLKFKKAVISTGGRPTLPRGVEGLAEAPFTTNEILFNLQELPPRMVVLGAGVIALEMAQTFAAFGTEVTVVQRSERLFQSKGGDPMAAEMLQKALEETGVKFVTASTDKVETVKDRNPDNPDEFPLMKVHLTSKGEPLVLECEVLLVATGRVSNVENLGLEAANVDYKVGKGITVNDLAQSVSNPNVYSVGDCTAGVPRLTHMSGEMAKLVVQNALFDDNWKLSELVVPAVAYTEPEYATVGIASAEMAEKEGIGEVDVYRQTLEHNDRGITESDTRGFCLIVCEKGTDKILGSTIVATRAGEMINEVSLAMKAGVSLTTIGRNIHSYPTTGEAVQFCGIQYINSHWKRYDEK